MSNHQVHPTGENTTVKNDIDSLISMMDQTFTSIDDQRQLLANKAMKIAMDVDLSNVNSIDNPDLLSARAQLLLHADKILTSREKAHLSKVGVALKKQSNDSAMELNSALVVQALRESAVQFTNPDDVANADAIAKIQSKLSAISDMDIDEGVLRADSKDIS